MHLLRISLLAVALLLQLQAASQAITVSLFDDDYGTDPGRVSYTDRWIPNPVIGPASIGNTATNFTASGEVHGSGLIQLQMPSALVGDGSAEPITYPMTFELSTQVNAATPETRYMFVNTNVNTLIPGFRSRTWCWTLFSNGDLRDNFGNGNVIATGLNPTIQYDFVLNIVDPLTGNGKLSYNGGNQNLTIPIGNESDADLQFFARMVDGSGKSMSVSHSSLSYTIEPPTPFNDNYGTAPGRVSSSVRWSSHPTLPPDSLVDNANGFTISESSTDPAQIRISREQVGNTGPIESPFTYEISSQASAAVNEARYVFYNNNVGLIMGGFPSRQWAWTVQSNGDILDGFGSGNVLGNIDPTAHHDFVLSVLDPLSGNGILSVDGSQNFVIPIGNESDTNLLGVVRMFGSGPGASLTVDHTAFYLGAVPEPASASLVVGAALLISPLLRTRSRRARPVV